MQTVSKEAKGTRGNREEENYEEWVYAVSDLAITHTFTHRYLLCLISSQDRQQSRKTARQPVSQAHWQTNTRAASQPGTLADKQPGSQSA